MRARIYKQHSDTVENSCSLAHTASCRCICTQHLIVVLWSWQTWINNVTAISLINIIFATQPTENKESDGQKLAANKKSYSTTNIRYYSAMFQLLNYHQINFSVCFFFSLVVVCFGLWQNFCYHAHYSFLFFICRRRRRRCERMKNELCPCYLTQSSLCCMWVCMVYAVNCHFSS